MIDALQSFHKLNQLRAFNCWKSAVVAVNIISHFHFFFALLNENVIKWRMENKKREKIDTYVK